MKKLFILIFCIALSSVSYSQYRWEVSAGATYSTLNLDNVDTSGKAGFFINAGYGYVLGYRAKTSIVFSLDLLQRKSEISETNAFFNNGDEISTLQVGLTPKFRYLFGSGKDRFRAFINVGPSFRVNTNFEVGGVELEDEAYEKLVIGGVYGAGFSQMIGEMFDIMAEVGVMNDFVDNFSDDVITGGSKFFDIYARVGIRFRIYDARR
ncbi:outer membrane beta-barrel protein [Aquimarina algicola]|uniref:Uncharacterized protein n=1 Tax=Aquimarina algicola TaxID=2589995 RepID=A0A504JPN3_9FLAO|nr:outer membrane beta-barrel protein [Aquimarina algicola]TPN88711.1 hypothetical protein FHK87_00415 [Aquimarina algicola]